MTKKNVEKDIRRVTRRNPCSIDLMWKVQFMKVLTNVGIKPLHSPKETNINSCTLKNRLSCTRGTRGKHVNNSHSLKFLAQFWLNFVYAAWPLGLELECRVIRSGSHLAAISICKSKPGICLLINCTWIKTQIFWSTIVFII